MIAICLSLVDSPTGLYFVWFGKRVESIWVAGSCHAPSRWSWEADALATFHCCHGCSTVQPESINGVQVSVVPWIGCFFELRKDFSWRETAWLFARSFKYLKSNDMIFCQLGNPISTTTTCQNLGTQLPDCHGPKVTRSNSESKAGRKVEEHLPIKDFHVIVVQRCPWRC